MIIQNVINFRFMNCSPFVSADSCLIRSFFVVVITRTSCSLVKSTAGVIYPDRVRLLESTFTSLTYPTKKSLKEPVTDMRCNNLFSDFNLIIVIGKFFKPDPAVFHLFQVSSDYAGVGS